MAKEVKPMAVRTSRVEAGQRAVERRFDAMIQRILPPTQKAMAVKNK